MVKGQKTVQNDKKLCPLHSLSQKPYIMWLSFMVHICKMIISSGFFFILSKICFSGYIRGRGRGKRAKNSPKWQNIVFCGPYLRNHTSYENHEPYIILMQMCRMIISPSVRVIKENCHMSRHFFFIFQNFDFPGC